MRSNFKFLTIYFDYNQDLNSTSSHRLMSKLSWANFKKKNFFFWSRWVGASILIPSWSLIKFRIQTSWIEIQKLNCCHTYGIIINLRHLLSPPKADIRVRLRSPSSPITPKTLWSTAWWSFVRQLLQKRYCPGVRHRHQPPPLLFTRDGCEAAFTLSTDYSKNVIVHSLVVFRYHHDIGTPPLLWI